MEQEQVRGRSPAKVDGFLQLSLTQAVFVITGLARVAALEEGQRPRISGLTKGPDRIVALTQGV